MFGQPNYTVEDTDNPAVIRVSGNCVVTGKPHTLTIPRASYDRWKGGEVIQRAFPFLNPDDREFLMTGIAPGDGWNTLFPEEDEEC